MISSIRLRNSGPEVAAHRVHHQWPGGLDILVLALAGQELGPHVGGHDDQGVAEVDRAALAVGQAPVVQHL
jgi:hypothetical protein